jgi:hypothetical protein
MDTYDQWHVSMYMRTHRAGDEIQQDPIRLKNLLGQAEEQLLEAGSSRPKTDDLLSPARALVDDALFWQRQGHGLGLFLSSGFSRSYRLPFPSREVVSVSDHFHIKPLLPAISNNGQFYLLTLSQHEIDLYRGSRYSLAEIDLEGVPESIVDILQWEDPEKHLQMHTGSEAVLDGGVAAVFHGHGVASQDDPKDYISRYFHRIDAGISDLLGDENAPLVVAGVEYLLPIYQEANSYPHLTEGGVARDPQEVGLEELHAEAWTLVEPLFRRKQEEALDAYRHLAGTASDRASNDLKEIVAAAHYERVEALFVALDQECWGSFAPQTGDIDVHQEARPGDRDLLDFAAAQTIQNGGSVFALTQDALPDSAPLAAVLRY